MFTDLQANSLIIPRQLNISEVKNSSRDVHGGDMDGNDGEDGARKGGKGGRNM